MKTTLQYFSTPGMAALLALAGCDAVDWEHPVDCTHADCSPSSSAAEPIVRGNQIFETLGRNYGAVRIYVRDKVNGVPSGSFKSIGTGVMLDSATMLTAKHVMCDKPDGTTLVPCNEENILASLDHEIRQGDTISLPPFGTTIFNSYTAKPNAISSAPFNDGFGKGVDVSLVAVNTNFNGNFANLLYGEDNSSLYGKDLLCLGEGWGSELLSNPNTAPASEKPGVMRAATLTVLDPGSTTFPPGTGTVEPNLYLYFKSNSLGQQLNSGDSTVDPSV